MKKVLTLLMLLCMVCTGAWAEVTPVHKHVYTIKGVFTGGSTRPIFYNPSASRFKSADSENGAEPQKFVFFSSDHSNTENFATFKVGVVEGDGYIHYDPNNNGKVVKTNAADIAFPTSSTTLATRTWEGGGVAAGYNGMIGISGTNAFRSYVVQSNTNINYNTRGSNSTQVYASNTLGATNSWQSNFLIEEVSGYEVYDLQISGSGTIIYDGTEGECLTTTAQSNGGYVVYKSGTIPTVSDFRTASILQQISQFEVNEDTKVITITLSEGIADGIYKIVCSNEENSYGQRGAIGYKNGNETRVYLAEVGTLDSDKTNATTKTFDQVDGGCGYWGIKTYNRKTWFYNLGNGKTVSKPTSNNQATTWADINADNNVTIEASTTKSGQFWIKGNFSSAAYLSVSAWWGTQSSGGVRWYNSADDNGDNLNIVAVESSLTEELQTTYAEQIAAAEFAISGGWTVVSTGLTSPAEGGVTYLCKNYTGAKAMLPLNLDRDGLIAMHVSGYNGHIESVNEETHTITVVYDQNYTETSVLWDGNGDVSNTKLPAARIPAMIKAHNGDILAFSDWRYSRDDVGRNSHGLGYQVDIEMRRSQDGGRTWSPAIIVANGDGGSDLATAGYGDASVVADSESDNVLLMCVNAAASNRFVRYTSSDNGVNWSGPTNIASEIATVAPGCTFFTSGKMVQSRDFMKTGAAYKRIYAPLCGGTADYVLYSDDFGQTWYRLGEGAAQTGTNNECRLVELPNGDILLDSRDGSARRINVFTYTNRETGEGTWGEQDQAGNMPTVDCNGDIDLVTGYAAGSEQPVKILLETMPRGGYNGGTRAHVQYYYKVLTENQYTLNDLKSGWVAGLEVCEGKSAYSSIIDLGNGSEAILYEKAHSDSETGYNGNPWGYDIKFETHTLSQITKGAYTHEPTSVLTINYTLTDMNGQTYEGSYQSAEKIAPTFTGANGYSLSEEAWGEVVDNTVTYTANINFGFPVSSNNVNKWVNLIYLPNYDRYISYDGSNAYMALQNRPNNANDPGTDKGKSNYLWSVIPVLEEGTNNFGFKIYNKKAQMYASAAGMAHNANVTLAAEGDVFHLIAPTATPANATHKDTNKGVFVKQSGDNTFSISVTSANNSVCLTYWNVTTSSHAGQNLDIVEAVPDAFTITYNISYNNQVIGTQTEEVARGEMPTGITAPDYITVGDYTPALTTCTEDATYSVVTSPKEGVFPFWGENVYTLRLRQSPLPFAVYVDPIDQTSVKSVERNGNNVYYVEPNRENYQFYNWQFGGDWINGYTIKNQATSKYISYGEAGVNNTNNTNASLVAAPETGAYFDLEHVDDHWFFKVHGSTSNYMSNYTDTNRTLATYNVQDYEYTRSQILIGSPETDALPAESAIILKNEIERVVTAIATNKQVGYPYYEADAPQDDKDKIDRLTEYLTNIQIVGNETYDDAYAALKAVCKITNVYMPQISGSYRVAFLLPNGDKKYISKQSVSGKVTENEGDAAVFTLGKSSEMTSGPGTGFKYILVDEDARFLSTTGSNTGVRDVYAGGCGFALVKAAQYEAQSSYNRYTIQQHLACFSLVMAANTSGDGGGWRPVYLTADGNITSDTSCWNSGVPEGATTAIVLETVANLNTVKLTNPRKDEARQTMLDQRYVGTFSAPYDVVLPDGVEAYKATVEDEVVTFSKVGDSGSIVPKNTGVLIVAPSAEANITECAAPSYQTVEIEEGTNAFVGSSAGSVVMVDGYYILGSKEYGVGFYPGKVGTTLARNKAYLDLRGQNVQSFTYKFEGEGMTTGILEALGLPTTVTPSFDLSGRRVDARSTRGLYIQNGRKVIR